IQFTRTESLLQAKSASREGEGRNCRPRADPRGCPWESQEVKVSLSEAPAEPTPFRLFACDPCRGRWRKEELRDHVHHLPELRNHVGAGEGPRHPRQRRRREYRGP